MRAGAGPVVGFVLVLLAGHGVLRLGGRRWPHRAYGWPAAVGLAWFAGVAALGALTTLVGVLRAGTRPLPVLAPILVLLAVAGLLPAGALPGRARPGDRAAADVRPGPELSGDPAGSADRPVRIGDLVAGATGIVVAVWVALVSAPIPVATNDEYALWMLRARALSQLGGLDPRVFGDPAAGYQHLEYPLFLPALFSWFDSWAGRPSDAAAHVAIAVTLGALLAVAGAVLTRMAGPAAAAVGLVLIVSVPTLLPVQSIRLMADVPVFAFAVGLALVLLLVLTLPPPDATPWLVAAAVLGAGAIGTKAEGTAFAGIAFAAALVLATGRRRGVFVAGVAAVVANLPWMAYTRAHHLGSWVANGNTLSTAHVRDVLPWTGHVLRGMLDRWPGGSWSGALLAVGAGVAAVLAVRAGWWRVVLFTAAVVAADTALLAAQYVVTAYGPPSDPLSRTLLESQLTVTVFRVALVPAALLAVAVPLFAGLALRPVGQRHRPAQPPAGAEVGVEPFSAASHRASRRT